MMVALTSTHKKIKVSTLVLPLILTFSLLWSCHVCEEEWEKRIVVGLYSACSNNNNSTASTNNNQKLHSTALVYHNIARQIMHEPCLGVDSGRCSLNITYKGFDVCEDAHALVEIANDVILGKDFNIDMRIVIPGIGEIVHFPGVSRVFMIMCYLTQDLQKLLLQLLTREKPPTVVFNPYLELPSTLSSFSSVLNRPTENIDILSKVLTLTKWKKLGFFHLKHRRVSDETGGGIYQMLYRQFEELLRTQFRDVCYFSETVDLENLIEVEKVVTKLQVDVVESIVILLGEPKDQIDFIRKVNNAPHVPRHTWIVHELFLPEKKLGDIGFALHESNKLEHVRVLSFVNPIRLAMVEIREQFLDDFKNYGYNTDIVYTQVELMKRMIKSSSSKAGEVKMNIDTWIKQIHVIFGYNGVWFYIVHLSGPKMDWALKVIKPFKGPPCKHQVCPPGWELKKQNFLPSFKKWEVEYGLACFQCEGNTIKTTFGSAQCTFCPKYYRSNADHTECVNPYKAFYSRNDTTYILCTALSFLGVCLDLVFIVVFVVKRSTPIVKSSDLTVTIIHSITSLVLFVAFFLFHHKHSATDRLSCVSYVAITGSFYNTFMAISLMKSHKLVKAFEAKTRSTTKEKQITILQQLFTIVILVAVSFILLVISIAQLSVEVVEERDETTQTILVYCSNFMHTSVQQVYGMILQIACFATAYKGRNLPDVFNESMTMVYSSFITTVSFVVMLAIQSFQRDRLSQQAIEWLVLSLNLNLYLLFFYGRKTFIILFRREKNTLSYIQRQTFASMEMSSKRISKPKNLLQQPETCYT